MQATLDRPSAATPHRFDVDDYHRMAAAGILSREDRVELIEGEIVDMAPIGSEHAATTDILAQLVTRALASDQAQVRVEGPLPLARRNELQPALMLLRPRPDRCRSGHPTAAVVLLLVEIADSSLAFDRGPKLALYARHGVPEVWIIDLVGRAVEISREPGPGGYSERRRVTKGSVTPALVPGLDLDVAAPTA